MLSIRAQATAASLTALSHHVTSFETRRMESNVECAPAASIKTENDVVFVRMEGDAEIWWPAVLYHSFQDLLDVMPAKADKRKFTNEWYGQKSKKPMVARLFGKKRPNKKLMRFIAHEEQETVVKDFFDNIEAFVEGYPGRDDAVGAALKWLNDECGDEEEEGVDDSGDACISPGGQLIVLEASLPVPGNGIRTSSPPFEEAASAEAAPSEVASLKAVSKNGRPKRKLSDTMDEMDAHSNEKEEPAKILRKSPRRTSTRKVQNADTSTRRRNFTTPDKPQNEEMKVDEPNDPTKCPSQSREETAKASISPGSAATSGTKTAAAAAAASKKAKDGNFGKSMKDVRKHDEWETVWDILQHSNGFTKLPGTGMVPVYYVTGQHAGKTVKQLQKLDAGTDYFKSEDAVKAFVRSRYEWVGPKGKANTPKKAPPGQSKQSKKASGSGIVKKPRSKVEKRDDWATALSILEYSLGLIQKWWFCDWIWIKLEHEDAKPAEMKVLMKILVKNEDYFTDEDLKAYAHEKFDWIGPEGKEYVPTPEKRLRKRSSKDIQNTASATKTSSTKQKANTPKKAALADSATSDTVVKTPPGQSKQRKKSPGSGIVKKPRSKVEKRDDWVTALSILEYSLGLIQKLWSGAWIWIKREHEDAKPAEMKVLMKVLVKNEDYFTIEEDLKAYALEKFGWIGPEGKEYVPTPGKRRRNERPHELKDTIQEKRQKLESKNPKAVSKTSKSAADTKKKNPNMASKPIVDSESVTSSGISVASDTFREGPTASLKERLAECSNCLNTSCAPDDLLFDGENSSSNFAATRKKIMSFLQDCIAGHGHKKKKASSFLYICGRPGTGKVRF